MGFEGFIKILIVELDGINYALTDDGLEGIIVAP